VKKTFLGEIKYKKHPIVFNTSSSSMKCTEVQLNWTIFAETPTNDRVHSW